MIRSFLPSVILFIFLLFEVAASSKVSIIVPIYNMERFLKDCLDSILNQSFNDLEIICVNDASSDNSSRILEEYKRKDKRIKVIIHHKNLGTAAAKNSGLEVAKGEYIGFVDADDYIHPNMLEILYKEIKKGDFDMAICDFSNRDEFEKPKFDAIDAYQTVEYQSMLSNNDYHYRLQYNVFWNKLYKKAILDKVRFLSGLCFCEDVYFNAHIREFIKKYVFVNVKLYYCRQSSNSLTRSKISRKYVDDICKIIEDCHNSQKIELSQGSKTALLKHLLLHLLCIPTFNNGTLDAFFYSCKKINHLYLRKMLNFEHSEDIFVRIMFAINLIIGKLQNLFVARA